VNHTLATRPDALPLRCGAAGKYANGMVIANGSRSPGRQSSDGADLTANTGQPTRKAGLPVEFDD